MTDPSPTPATGAEPEWDNPPMPCPSCGGRGSDDEGYCSDCNGWVLREPRPATGAEHRAVEEVLRPWLRHRPECAERMLIDAEPCSCGLVAALASLAPRPSGLSEADEQWVAEVQAALLMGVFAGDRHQVISRLVAIIDRLTTLPETPSAEPTCRHAIYHHGCPACDFRDPEPDDWAAETPPADQPKEQP